MQAPRRSTSPSGYATVEATGWIVRAAHKRQTRLPTEATESPECLRTTTASILSLIRSSGLEINPGSPSKGSPKTGFPKIDGSSERIAPEDVFDDFFWKL